MITQEYTAENYPLIIKMSPVFDMTDEQFFEFCQLNRDYRFEKSATGELMIMSPTGSETGNRNFNLLVQLGNWIEKDGTGIGFDSSTGFILPNGATRSPDAAWIKKEKWDEIEQEKKIKFAPICPDFIVEIRSPSDAIQPLQDKLQEYIDNGVLLGWLIDRKNRQVYIYRPQKTVECLDNPQTLSGEDILPGFVLELKKIW
ncbi:MAG: Uma2 family endonuclease [Crocosphaera sp.]